MRTCFDLVLFPRKRFKKQNRIIAMKKGVVNIDNISKLFLLKAPLSSKKSSLLQIMTLLQNDATLYYKTRQLFLLQNEVNLYYKTRQLFYYKMSRFYYKTRQELQNAPFLLQNSAGITRCADYYKTRHNIDSLAIA